MGGDGAGNTGGTTEPDADNGWNDTNTGTLWGWLDGVVSGLETVWEAITNLPQLIADALSGLFNTVKDAILSVPTLILDGLKEIFIPDVEDIQSKFNSFLETLKQQWNFDTEFFTSLFDEEKPVEDVYTDYEIPGVGSFKLKMFDVKYFVQGVEYFRPFIRGFLVLLMAFYNIKMVLSFIRQDAGVLAGKGSDVATEINERGKEK